MNGPSLFSCLYERFKIDCLHSGIVCALVLFAENKNYGLKYLISCMLVFRLCLFLLAPSHRTEKHFHDAFTTQPVLRRH